MSELLVNTKTNKIMQSLRPYGLNRKDLEILARTWATGEVMMETGASSKGKLAREFTRLSGSEEHEEALANLLYTDDRLRNG